MKTLIGRIYFWLTGKCPECGADQWFLMDANEWYHCSNCDWSEKDGPIENRLRIEDSCVGEGLNHQS